MAIQYSASFLFRSKHQFKLTSPKRVHKHFEEISKDNQDRYKENYPPPSTEKLPPTLTLTLTLKEGRVCWVA